MRVRTVPSQDLSKTRKAEPTAKLPPAYNDALKDLNNRVALVTGGSRGIGAAVAIALSGAGANVAVNFREGADAANAVCAEITQMGRKAFATQVDVSVLADVRRMVAAVEGQLGGIDILVNNAAISHGHAECVLLASMICSHGECWANAPPSRIISQASRASRTCSDFANRAQCATVERLAGGCGR